jgi:hypothetical protein
MDDSVTEAVTRMVTAATREADTRQGEARWIMLQLLAEIHRRTAAEITALADACQPPPSAPPRHRQN